MIKVLIAGDFVPQDRTAIQIKAGDYSSLIEVKPFAQEADYSIVNFESPVVTRESKPIDKTGPNLHCVEQAMECVASNGFKCVTLANNHFRDQGQIGIEDTLDACLKYNVDYIGGGRNLAEAERILYKEINGQRLAIVNLCENEWSIAGKNYGGSNPLNPVKNYYAIKLAKEKADYVLVIVHGGIEGYPFPTPRMQDTYRFFVDAGADAVINHHQHCYSGYEEYKRKPIFYGLGNFCFDHKGERGSIWNEGYMVSVLFSGKDVNYNVIPYTQCDETPAVKLMEGKKARAFENQLFQINKTIADPYLLYLQFQKKINSLYEYRILALEPFNNKVINLLQQRHLFPRLIKREQMKSMFMRVSCESNRESLFGVLKKYFNL